MINRAHTAFLGGISDQADMETGLQMENTGIRHKFTLVRNVTGCYNVAMSRRIYRINIELNRQKTFDADQASFFHAC